MSAEHVLTMLNEHEVELDHLCFTDTKKKIQPVTIPSHKVGSPPCQQNSTFDGSSIGGCEGVDESDMVL
ncbi:glutamine synthetase beta-grasp domain-containing protein [Klebsiella pneumoniae]|uniref:glutamine synthetase beta-grasp domain-containing protein n=1 Tax=Klebsiella pneumoniae TaxID=573 RepID=UPI003987F492